MCDFMQALMRPCPGWTSPQNCLISGLHARAAAIAPGRICASAPDVESNKMAPMVRAFFNIVYTSIRNSLNTIDLLLVRLSPYYFFFASGRSMPLRQLDCDIFRPAQEHKLPGMKIHDFVAGLEPGGTHVAHLAYQHGIDKPEITDWRWPL
jgi:hypothetical protein